VYSPQSSFEKRETEPKHRQRERENNSLVKTNEGKRRALMDLWSDAVPVAHSQAVRRENEMERNLWQQTHNATRAFIQKLHMYE
jgi:hypothetical protein